MNFLKNSIINPKSLLGKHNQVTPSTYNKQILDPLTSLIKICLLNFKDKGTKLSITNNQISFHHPDLLQGTIRWKNGDNRLDLHNLCNPIEKGMQWYDCNEDINIRNIFGLACYGLKKLRESYYEMENSNIVCDALSHYITLIQDALDHSPKPNDKSDFDSNINKSLRNMWDIDEIAIISSLLLMAKSRKHHQDVTYLVKAIECLLEDKDNISHELVLKYTTTL